METVGGSKDETADKEQNASSTGSVSLRDFWIRRAKRLLPAALLLLVAVAAYCWLLAPTDRLGAIRDDAIATRVIAEARHGRGAAPRVLDDARVVDALSPSARALLGRAAPRATLPNR